MRVVVALGGNALSKRGETLNANNLQRNIKSAAGAIASIGAEHTVAVTHGNGPQVGLLSLQNESYDAVPPYPLDILGAETEGMIGYLLERELRGKIPGREIATLLTQVTVSSDDPAFMTATKPIGKVYDALTAENLARERNWQIVPDGNGFRRAVPSPRPCRIIEIEAIRILLEAGVLVVCLGGGGIPVNANEETKGVEAVVDKDFSAALLAQQLDADLLLLLTDVDGVYTDWNSEVASRINKISPTALRTMEFDPGSMGPKVLAACEFATHKGKRAAIGSIEQASQILSGNAGTQIHSKFS